jgi:hypothetical protein
MSTLALMLHVDRAVRANITGLDQLYSAKRLLRTCCVAYKFNPFKQHPIHVEIEMFS